MANVVVVGAQWGDEGKGKIVDWLSERADVIARFQGGHNAGHTLVVGESVYKLHALPSGVVRGGKLSVIGNGVVLDPWHLMKEIETVRGQGVDISPESLMIAENTPLILPLHGELDRANPAPRGADLGALRGRLFPRPVQLTVQGQDQGRVLGNHQRLWRDLDALRRNRRNLFHQMPGVQHHAVADDAQLAAAHHTGG